ncbi:glycoside hydrolase family 26 protein [Frankia sp. QA3]|uniref:glycoside hydrolase family 26 protein n=1 Tax=Frankia sp. QA3 TaxID=710111 RepID=UPI000269CC4C|nr:glycosyl hydrolase [Frankia sp. QA3]EIV95572.1 beta-mannanase [Frankia sp. QA3]
MRYSGIVPGGRPPLSDRIGPQRGGTSPTRAIAINGGGGPGRPGADTGTMPLPGIRTSGPVDSGASTGPETSGSTLLSGESGESGGAGGAGGSGESGGSRWRMPRSRRGRALAVTGLAAVLVVVLGVVGLVVLGGGGGGGGSGPPAPQAGGVAWPSGANANPPHDLATWERWLGRRTDVAVVFTVRDNWQKIVGDDWPLSELRPQAYAGKVSVAQPLFPKDGNEAACARGDYDANWATFGRTLVRNGRGDAFVRLGWEFNGDWFWWYPRDTATWRTCFQRAVTAIRSTSPDVRIDWNVSAHRDSMPNGDNVWAAYPGDGFVDVVSIDAYDSYPPSLTRATFDAQCHQDSGACTVARFAHEHGKRFAVPEWGVVRSAGGGADNPYYIQKMYELFQANRANLAYEAYFTATDAGNVQSSLFDPPSNPRAAQRYRALFGAQPPQTTPR